MMFSKSQPGIIYLHRDGLDLYTSTLPNILKINFSSKTVSDLEVVDQQGLIAQLKSFIQGNNIPIANLVIVLAESVCFQKNFPHDLDFDTKLKQQQAFIDNVPFEKANTKTFKTKESERIVATNRDLYETVKWTFEQMRFTVEAVVPISIVPLSVPVRDGIDLEIAKLFLEKHETLRQYSLFVNKVVKEKQVNKEAKKINSKFILLIIVFILLFCLLAFMLVRDWSKESSAKKSQQAIPTISVNPSPIPTKIAILQTNINLQNLKIKILYGAGNTNQADLLVSYLVKLGIEDITLESSTGTINTPNNLIAFSPTLSIALRQQIISELEKNYNNLSIQESDNSDYDVTIVIENLP